MKKILILLLILVLNFGLTNQSRAGVNFKDMDNHWANGVIVKLVDLGAVGGYGDGTFKPNSPITRAEFSKILKVSLGLDKIEGSSFTDTTNHWAKNDINTLVHYGIIEKAEYGTT